ncbi:bestrophin family ion channel [Christiangramia aquimixticola]|uniref:bestrophin family ion channel n=1 Tax=Christiangramia aquimixticola TaxID=1697558 RepID=UPI003AA84989
MKFDLKFNVDLTLLSIAIIFPLVFTIRGSFKRREKALEHLSDFISSVKTVKYFLLINETLTPVQKEEAERLLVEINNKTLEHLAKRNNDIKILDENSHMMYKFVLEKENLIPYKLKDRIFKYMKAMHESIENLHAIHTHRTPISLMAYCEVFIYIFPLIYAPTIIYNLGIQGADWIAYFIVLLTQFILISLYNIQNQLEYPFDNIGMDDIDLDNFKIER